MTIPILNCKDCGACCFEQGSPPGYGYLLAANEHGREQWPDQTDLERIRNLPADALQAIKDYWRAMQADELDGDGPCCWLDQTTMRCRWYDHRPQICRDLDVGSEGCRVWRDEYNIDVEALK